MVQSTNNTKIIFLFLLTLLSFRGFAQQPIINSFFPTSGAVGTVVTIIGTNISNTTSVIIGGVAAIKVSNNGDTVVAMVMPGTVNGAITLTTASGSTKSTANYIVKATGFPNIQQGNKLVGTGFVLKSNSPPEQGSGVAISADGNTAVVGGPYDSIGLGAIWIYIKIGNVWKQQGNKLVGTGYNFDPSKWGVLQGFSVAISADGNTVVEGGIEDSIHTGAIWIFTRTSGVWSQQGNKLVGTGIDSYMQGSSVSISADGNTAVVGGWKLYLDSTQSEVWVFVRNGGEWSQQGDVLLGNYSYWTTMNNVAISADGNTIVSSQSGYIANQGATWIYTRNNGKWSQQGPKLVEGCSVAISADGNKVILGGWLYKSGQVIDVARYLIRTEGVWSQHGNELVATGSVLNLIGGGEINVAISADGNTALLGDFYDNLGIGATWVFIQSQGNWYQQGNKLVGSGVSEGKVPSQGWSISLSADGNTAIVGGPDDNKSIGAAWIFGLNTDSILSNISKVSLNCAGKQVGIRLNQPMLCKSLAKDGSDFSFMPTHPKIDSIIGFGCAVDTLMDSITINFASPLDTGTYKLSAKVAKDGNSILGSYNQTLSTKDTFSFARTIVDASFTTNIKYGCLSDTVQLIANKNFTSLNNWYWNIDGIINKTTRDTTLIYSDFTPKQLQLFVYYGDCRDSNKVNIVLPKEGVVKAGFVIEKKDGNTNQPTDNICPTEKAIFNNTSSGNITHWYWNFGDNQTSTLETPTPTFPITDSVSMYSIRLIVKNNYCADTATNILKVIPNCYIAVSSAFTPNGDGVNDWLYPLNAWKADNLEFRVFDRYGQMVFETRDWTVKWDGRIKGADPIFGTYIWTLNYTDHDTKERVSLKGTSVLIR